MVGARAVLVIAAPFLAALSACAPSPLSVEQAERVCIGDALDAHRPRGEVALGVGVGGGGSRSIGQVGMTVSSDYLMRRDPSDVFARCVMQRSGQMPSRPLHQQPGWRG